MAKLSFHDVSPGNSLFQFMKNVWLAERTVNSRVVHRLCTLMRKMDVSGAIIEEINEAENASAQEELESLREYFKCEIDFEIYRVIFTGLPCNDLTNLYALKSNIDFLSDTTVINYRVVGGPWKSYIFYSICCIPTKRFGAVDSPRRPLLNNYLHAVRKFQRFLTADEGQRIDFTIYGTYFNQQNALTTRCAQASLCTVINNSLGQTADLVLPLEINKVLGIPGTNLGTGPQPGLTNQQIEAALLHFGFSVQTDIFTSQDTNMAYADTIYRYVESGAAVLLNFTTTDTSLHIVPIVGHTLNTDLWRPEAEPAYGQSLGSLVFRQASAWVDHFIMHDDNFGMYYCMPVDSLRRKTPLKGDEVFRAAAGFYVLPKAVESRALLGEWGNISLLQLIIHHCAQASGTINYWLSELTLTLQESTNPPPGACPRPFIVRTFLCDKESYLRNLSLPDYEGNNISEDVFAKVAEGLPDIFWITEFTIPDLYTANRHKLADALFRCDMPLPDLTGMDAAAKQEIFNQWIIDCAIFLRMPGIIVKPSSVGTPDFATSIATFSHFPLSRKQDEYLPPEW